MGKFSENRLKNLEYFDSGKLESNRAFRETPEFLFNHQVLLDREYIENYRLMVFHSRSRRGYIPEPSTLNHFRCLLSVFEGSDPEYLKQEVLMEDWEIDQLNRWVELTKRAGQGIEDDDYYNPDDYIDEGDSLNDFS